VERLVLFIVYKKKRKKKRKRASCGPDLIHLPRRPAQREGRPSLSSPLGLMAPAANAAVTPESERKTRQDAQDKRWLQTLSEPELVTRSFFLASFPPNLSNATSIDYSSPMANLVIINFPYQSF